MAFSLILLSKPSLSFLVRRNENYLAVAAERNSLERLYQISLDDLDEVRGQHQTNSLAPDAELVLEVAQEVAKVDVKHLKTSTDLKQLGDHCDQSGNAHLHSEARSIRTADLLVLTG